MWHHHLSQQRPNKVIVRHAHGKRKRKGTSLRLEVLSTQQRTERQMGIMGPKASAGARSALLQIGFFSFDNLQGLDHRKLQREATDRLNEFAETFRGAKANLAGKNLGDEGAAYLAENLAFNDRCLSSIAGTASWQLRWTGRLNRCVWAGS